MEKLGQFIDRRSAISADSCCEAALTAFVHDPDCRVLAVVDGHRPIGVLQREAFLARMESQGAADRPIQEAIDAEPLLADAETPVRAFVEQAMASRPPALQGGFAVTTAGAYAGVGDLLSLAGWLMAPRGDGSLIERVCAEAHASIADAVGAAEGLRRLRLPEGAESHLETITEAGRSTLALLGVAAELQRVLDGRLEIDPSACKLQALMDDLDGRWRQRSERAGVTLLVSYDGQPDCSALIDHARLVQVFDALIGHAMARPSCAVIEVSLQATPRAGGVALAGRVRDNGAPCSNDYLARLFDGAGEGRPAGGIGIQQGLMLAGRVIAAMDGTLDARSNTGSGATIRFDLLAGAVAAGGEAAERRSDGPARSAHILVVDDNATNRMVVEALCEMFDCSTESVVDGIEAVDAARAGRFDIVLMDIKMPRMDGVTAAREIRKLPAPAGRVPIIALTANADPDEVKEYRAAGMCSVVEKPIKPERLMEALDAALAEGPSRAAAA